jgi:uncharacterized protein YcbX
MDAGEAVGRVQALWRFPVKSIRGEELDSAEVTGGGVLGDRSYAIVDGETGKVASAKHPKLWPDLLKCRAAFVEEPRAGAEQPPVRIELADGTSVRTDDPDAGSALSSFFGRAVELSAAAPGGFTIDNWHPDEDYDPQGRRDEVVESTIGAAWFNERGLPSPVPPDSFFDAYPLTVLTRSTLDRLGELEPELDFDLRRFRMNVIVDTPAPGFVENGWVGRSLAMGDEVRMAVESPDPRCVMPSLAQEGGVERDPRILKAIARHNRIEVNGLRYPCAGVYAVAQATGTIRKDDVVRVT